MQEEGERADDVSPQHIICMNWAKGGECKGGVVGPESMSHCNQAAHYEKKPPMRYKQMTN